MTPPPVTASPANPAASPRNPALDGVRGLAALCILVWHYIPSMIVAPPGTDLAYLKRLLSLCWGGVGVFFVLSGYLIGSILLRERGSKGYFSAFYARRALRIGPLYFTLLTLYALLMAWFSPHHPYLAAAWRSDLPGWSYWVFAQNLFMPAAGNFGSPLLGVCWSLAVEEQFYLLLPLVIRRLPAARLPWALMAGILAAPLLRYLWIGSNATYVLLPMQLDSLLLGVLLAWCLAEPARAARLAAGRGAIGVTTALLALGAFPLLEYGNGLHVIHTPGGWLVPLWIGLVTTGVLALVLTAAPGAAGPRVLAWAPLRWAGLRAYGIYLLHPWALCLTFAAMGLSRVELTSTGGWTPLLVATALTFAAAAASYRWLERPCLRLGHRLRY